MGSDKSGDGGGGSNAGGSGTGGGSGGDCGDEGSGCDDDDEVEVAGDVLEEAFHGMSIKYQQYNCKVFRTERASGPYDQISAFTHRINAIH